MARHRNIAKTAEEYKKKLHSNKIKDAFFISDYEQIVELSGGNLVEAIDLALKVGYMAGYKRGKKEQTQDEFFSMN